MKTPFHLFVDQPGFSLTLLNLTRIAKSASSVEEVASFIDALLQMLLLRRHYHWLHSKIPEEMTWGKKVDRYPWFRQGPRCRRTTR